MLATRVRIVMLHNNEIVMKEMEWSTSTQTPLRGGAQEFERRATLARGYGLRQSKNCNRHELQ